MRILDTKQPFMGTCRSCPAPIFMRWVEKKDGAEGWHPFDSAYGMPSDVSHFETCPAARHYRNGRRPPEAQTGRPHEHAWKNQGARWDDDANLVQRQRCNLPGCWAERDIPVRRKAP